LVTADIGAGVAQDAAANPNTAAAQFTRTYDTVSPPTDLSLSGGSVEENQPVGTVVGTLSTTDPGDVHTYTLVTGAGDTDNGSFSIVGDEVRTGAVFDFETQSSYSIRVQTDDGNGGTYQEALSIMVTDVNDAPVIGQGTGPLTVAMSEDGAPVAWSAPGLTATDVDGDTLTWSVSSPAAHGTAMVSGTGASPALFTYAPEADYSGPDSFEVQVSDGNGGTDTITVDVIINPVNDAPVLDPIGPKTVDESQLLEFVVTGSDIDLDDLTFDAAGLPTGASFDPSTQTFSWTPGYGEAGVYTDILFRVTDNGVPPASDWEMITITVGDVNRPPVLDPIGNLQVDEGQLLEFVVTGADPDGDGLTGLELPRFDGHVRGDRMQERRPERVTKAI
jgi:hypothetical protein